MDCSCVDINVDCYSEILSDTLPVARKEHRCVECSRVIRKGERYRKEKTVYEGRMATYKTCSDCDSIRQAFVCGGCYWGEVLEAVWNAMSDCGGDFSETTVASLTKLARERICGMIERSWGENE